MEFVTRPDSPSGAGAGGSTNVGYKRGTDYTSRGYSAFDANRDPEGADSPMGASMGGLVASMVKSSIGNDEIDPANAKFKVSQTTTRSDRVDPDSGLSQVMDAQIEHGTDFFSRFLLH